MKKMTSFAGMLAMAAILTVGFSACSNEEILDNTVQPTEPQKIHVTVGAGLGDAETRSEVATSTNSETGKTIRTLKFTEGDRLYVEGDLPDDKYRMTGYLTLVSGAGTTTATFSGNLTVWKKEGDAYTEDKSYKLTNRDNPMLEYGTNEVTATLIHKDAISGAISIDNNTKLCSFNYGKCLVTGQTDNAKKLMETGIHVRGTYDATNGSFALSCGDPVFNCNFTIAGLTYRKFYYVRVVKGDNNTTYDQTVISDANGYVNFAITTGLKGNGNWKIQLSQDSHFYNYEILPTYERPIGNKTLGAKVYNVGNYTAPDPGTEPEPTLNPTKDVVSLSQVTSAFVGNIVGSDGKVYPPNTDFTSPTYVRVKKAAMIGYVSSTGHGLAIELNSSPAKKELLLAQDYSPSNDVSGYTWRLPTLADWQNMVNGCGGAEGFRSKYNATGVSFYLDGTVTQYWTNDYYDTDAHEVSGIWVEGKRYYRYVEFRVGSSNTISFYDDTSLNEKEKLYTLDCFEF